MKNLIKPSIGIWGFGRVGKAALRFLAARAQQIFVYDARPLSSDEINLLDQYGAKQAASLDALFDSCDQILPSPGIDIEPYQKTYGPRFLNELDLFFDAWQKPIVAITGSVGKTTTTTLITQLLQESGLRLCAAGNIGLPVFEVIDKRNELDAIVLEVSSFQLENCMRFAPDIAVWTNFFPNHLDRHKTVENYFDAKYALIKNQTAVQHALIPYELADRIAQRKPRSTVHTFGTQSSDAHYTLNNNAIVHAAVHPPQILINLADVPDCTFPLNWLVAYSVLDLMHVSATPLKTAVSLEHRLEKVATINGVTFYNDSKSTVPISTLAAVNTIKAPRILLFLGGLSKGIDRAPFIALLAQKPLSIFCFGKEAQDLHTMCKNSGIASSTYTTLEDAFIDCISQIESGDCVLFSPAGSSYDLFKNYEERGKAFKNQVLLYQKSLQSSR